MQPIKIQLREMEDGMQPENINLGNIADPANFVPEWKSKYITFFHVEQISCQIKKKYQPKRPN